MDIVCECRLYNAVEGRVELRWNVEPRPRSTRDATCLGAREGVLDLGGRRELRDLAVGADRPRHFLDAGDELDHVSAPTFTLQRAGRFDDQRRHCVDRTVRGMQLPGLAIGPARMQVTIDPYAVTMQLSGSDAKLSIAGQQAISNYRNSGQSCTVTLSATVT